MHRPPKTCLHLFFVLFLMAGVSSIVAIGGASADASWGHDASACRIQCVDPAACCAGVSIPAQAPAGGVPPVVCCVGRPTPTPPKPTPTQPGGTTGAPNPCDRGACCSGALIAGLCLPTAVPCVASGSNCFNGGCSAFSAQPSQSCPTGGFVCAGTGQAAAAGSTCPTPNPQPQQGTYCADSNTTVPFGQTCPTTTRPVATPIVAQPAQPALPTPPPLAATITISGQNPVRIAIHANQYLDLRHSVVVHLDPGVQATTGIVSTGSLTFQGNQVTWNGFTMNAGDDGTLDLNLVNTSNPDPSVSGHPAISNITMEALDLSGNQVVIFKPGDGATTGSLVAACTIATGQTVVGCATTGTLTSPQFTVSGTWNLSWSYSACPDSSSTLLVTVLNGDGSQMDSKTLSQPPSSGSGQQQYSAGGSYSVGVTSPCTWSIQVQQ